MTLCHILSERRGWVNRMIRKCLGDNKFTNHLIYMDEIKVFPIDRKELETPTQIIIKYNQNIGMEFGIEKYVRLIMKKRKNGRNRSNKSKRHQFIWRKRKLVELRNISSGHHQTKTKKKNMRKWPRKKK